MIIRKTVTLHDYQIRQIKEFIENDDRFESKDKDFSRALRAIIKEVLGDYDE